MRVLAIARRRWDAQHTRLSEADTKGEFELLGLVGMIDPPRQEAIDAVAACQRAGIVVKMITGDHKITAEAIGRQLGLLSEADHAIDGPALERMDDQALARAALATHVFARVAPEHKLRLVRALQAQGHVVAMTGDGVNDAPALKQANIGVAMGITGTAVSRESADIVLADDNFASIAAAVEEGRRVYDNLVKSLAFILPTNLGLALILLSAVLFFPQLAGQPLLPMRPTQILWINLVAAVALALPLAFEAMERDVMKRPPRRPDAPLLSGFVIQRTMIVGVLMAGGAIGLFLYEYHREVPRVGHAIALAEAQTMAVLTVVLFQVFYLLNCRSLRESVLQIGLFSNRSIYAGIGALLVLQVALMYVPAMNTLFGTMGLNVDAWVKSALVAAVILPVISIEKWIRNWMHEHRHGHGEHSAVLETRPS
jgi:Ca2+-transporting ATPase